MSTSVTSSHVKRTLPIGVSISQVSLSSGAPLRIVLVSFVRVYPGLGFRFVGKLEELDRISVSPQGVYTNPTLGPFNGQTCGHMFYRYER